MTRKLLLHKDELTECVPQPTRYMFRSCLFKDAVSLWHLGVRALNDYYRGYIWINSNQMSPKVRYTIRLGFSHSVLKNSPLYSIMDLKKGVT